jgi:hypothetical protein
VWPYSSWLSVTAYVGLDGGDSDDNRRRDEGGAAKFSRPHLLFYEHHDGYRRAPANTPPNEAGGHRPDSQKPVPPRNQFLRRFRGFPAGMRSHRVALCANRVSSLSSDHDVYSVGLITDVPASEAC